MRKLKYSSSTKSINQSLKTSSIKVLNLQVRLFYPSLNTDCIAIASIAGAGRPTSTQTGMSRNNFQTFSSKYSFATECNGLGNSRNAQHALKNKRIQHSI